MVVALLTQQHINTGAFGLFGFPIIALIYAFIRKSGETDRVSEQTALHDEIRNLRRRLDQMDPRRDP